MFLIEVATAT